MWLEKLKIKDNARIEEQPTNFLEHRCSQFARFERKKGNPHSHGDRKNRSPQRKEELLKRHQPDLPRAIPSFRKEQERSFRLVQAIQHNLPILLFLIWISSSEEGGKKRRTTMVLTKRKRGRKGRGKVVREGSRSFFFHRLMGTAPTIFLNWRARKLDSKNPWSMSTFTLVSFMNGKTSNGVVWLQAMMGRDA